MSPRKILVFCGSKLPEKKSFSDSMTELVQLLKQSQSELIFGASNVGLMKLLCEGCHSEGVKVTGVITQKLMEKGIAFRDCDELIVAKELHERKLIMMDNADAVVCFPGGVGTIDELFSAMATNSLKETNLPIYLLNISGYYDPLIEFLKSMCRAGFMKKKDLDALFVLGSVEELSKHLL